MQPAKPSETKIIIVVPAHEPRPEPKKPKANPVIIKATRLISITLINVLFPEATIGIVAIKLLFILLEWLNQKKA